MIMKEEIMKTITKTLSALLALMLGTTLLVGCEGKTQTKTVYELPYYSGTNVNEITGEPEYNQNLWRRNSDLLSGADPFILDNTAQDGYYYLYSTGNSNGFSAYRTKNFTTWEGVGQILEGEDGWSAYWAPEVAAEENADGGMTYYLFYSAMPSELAASDGHVMFVATADSPAGPFEMVDFTDEASCGAGNTHASAGDMSYGKFALFDYEAMCEALNEECGTEFTVSDLPSLIDSHPFVTANGEKYIYFSLEDPRGIVGMKMENWYSIDYSTVTLLTRVGYYSLEDYEKEQAGEYVEKNEYELIGAEVNEGPEVIEHDGKFYLTFSVNGFYDASYSVMQSVGDSPLGPFTKLKDDQNGLFLSADLGGNAMASGTGHHSFFTIGDKLYLCYHRHNIVGSIDGGRGICVDELKWVETEGENGEKLDVLYANGPTVTVQPRFDAEAEYTNIAEEGTVSLVSGTPEDGSSAEFLNDGLLSYNVSVDQAFLDEHVKEAVTTTNATYEIVFDGAREIRGFMVYGSKYTDRYFAAVRDIELVAEENGAEKIYYIEELPIDDSCVVYNEDELALGNYVIENIVYGSGVYAEFNAINVKSIRFTVVLPEGQESVGVSEIAVLGKQA